MSVPPGWSALKWVSYAGTSRKKKTRGRKPLHRSAGPEGRWILAPGRREAGATRLPGVSNLRSPYYFVLPPQRAALKPPRQC
jgi:hypothetical protein